MNVLIIEDEKPAARRLHRMLAKLNIDVQQMLHSVEESLNWLQNNKHPDLIFLDMESSMNVYEVEGRWDWRVGV